MRSMGTWGGVGRMLLATGLLAALPAAGAQTVEYFHTDALGTPVAVSNASGSVIERSEYAPYGELLNRPATDGPGFTGHVQDTATGMTYMQQRYYDPMIGRFLSVDPVTANSGTGANFNRYWYAANNPYKFIDPDGRYICQAGKRQCAQVSEAIKRIARSFRDSRSRSLRGRASTAAIARFYGKEGVDNGVVVMAASGNFSGTAETKDGITSVSINFQGISNVTKGMDPAVTQSMIDATVVHEGSHGFEQKMRAKNLVDPMKTTLQGRYNEEVRAYRAEAIFSRGLNEDSLWGYWTKDGGINEEAIKKSAKESVDNACGAGGCGQ